jgi:mitofilin
MSSLLAIKKLAGASALAVGSGYTGAVIYGSSDEVTRGILGQHLPGYHNSVEAYQILKSMGETVWSKIGGQLKVLWSSRPNSAGIFERHVGEHEVLTHEVTSDIEAKTLVRMKELQEKYLKELEVLRARLQKEQDESFAKELSRKEEMEYALSAAKREQQSLFALELEKILEDERQLRISSQNELMSRIDELEMRTEQILRKYTEVLNAGSISTIIECLALIAGGEATAKKHVLLRALNSMMERAEGDLVRGVCRSLISTTQRMPTKGIDRPSLVSEFYRRRSLAEIYSDFDGTQWFHIFPLFRRLNGTFLSLLKGETIEAKYVSGQLSLVESLIKRGDLEGALRATNDLSGWPRIVLKDWMDRCRRLLELEQGLMALKSYHLAIRID